MNTEAEKHEGVENGMPPKLQFYGNKYGLNDQQLNNLPQKFKKDKDFVQPSTDAEREYVLDLLI